MDRVDLALAEASCGALDSDLDVSIHSVAGGVPTDQTLASATVPASRVTSPNDPVFIDVVFTAPATVQAGTQYAIVAAAPAQFPSCNGGIMPHDYRWWGTTNVYGYGSAVVGASSGTNWIIQPDDDMAFRTYVDPTPSFAFTGFFAPVDNPPTLNVAKAGSAIPVKFSLGGDRGQDILASNSPASGTVACGGSADVIEQTDTSGSSGLSYDAATQQYKYAWKTSKAWAGTCRQFVLTLKDGTTHVANFQFK
jgi:hypothetical protein